MKLSTGFLLFIFAMLGSTVAVGQFINIGGTAQPRSDASTNGYLASSDWTLFNAKQVTLLKADGTHNGYLGSTDWTAFTNKQPNLGYSPVDRGGDTMTGSLALATNGLAVGTNQLVVASNKVGIGTAVPATPLTVYAVGAASGGLRVVSDLTGNPFEIQTAGGTHWMYMDTGSNTWFHGGVYVDEGAVHLSAAVVAYGFGTDYTTGLFQSTHGVLNFSANGTEAMRLDSSQNLAIGTTTAVQKLTVAGLIKMAVQAAASTPACGATTDGTLAITSAHIVCVCTGTSFVKVSDGSTACTF